LLNNAEKYKYLLPGNCIRDSGWSFLQNDESL
jgi:hypothetical protein